MFALPRFLARRQPQLITSPQIINPDEILFSERLPDHLLQAGTVLDEAAACDALVENKEPLKSILIRLHEDNLNLTSALQTIPPGEWECSAPHSPSEVLVQLGETLKSRAVVAMRTLW